MVVHAGSREVEAEAEFLSRVGGERLGHALLVVSRAEREGAFGDLEEDLEVLCLRTHVGHDHLARVNGVGQELLHIGLRRIFLVKSVDDKQVVGVLRLALPNFLLVHQH